MASNYNKTRKQRSVRKKTRKNNYMRAGGELLNQYLPSNKKTTLLENEINSIKQGTWQPTGWFGRKKTLTGEEYDLALMNRIFEIRSLLTKLPSYKTINIDYVMPMDYEPYYKTLVNLKQHENENPNDYQVYLNYYRNVVFPKWCRDWITRRLYTGHLELPEFKGHKVPIKDYDFYLSNNDNKLAKHLSAYIKDYPHVLNYMSDLEYSIFSELIDPMKKHLTPQRPHRWIGYCGRRTFKTLNGFITQQSCNLDKRLRAQIMSQIR